MLEKSQPFKDALRGVENGADLVVGSVDSPVRHDGGVGVATARAGDALRAIEWGELTARLNAARELRRELREEAMLCAGASGARFGDAAAGFFNSLNKDELGVNPKNLEGCKTSCCISSEQLKDAAKGDARDKV